MATTKDRVVTRYQNGSPLQDRATLTLLDEVVVQVCYERGGHGQHAGSPRVVVVLKDEYGRGPITLCSGLRSFQKTLEAVNTCDLWCEVPLAIEAVYWWQGDMGPG